MSGRQRRLAIAAAVLAAMGLACALVLNALRSNLVFFYTPSQVAAHQPPAGRAFRLGGLVQRGSLQRDGLAVQFDVTDLTRTIRVRYEGVLPDLFREGRGVVAQGLLGADGVFVAQEVLAKHDERYAPPASAPGGARP
jgi:cytochrome c-type biogenesis protein CcmE